MLVLDQVNAGYGGLQVLHEVSLEVEAGEVVALVGANGAGKTTTLRTIAGLLVPSAGRIELEGESVVGLGPHDLVRRGVVMVAEDRELFGALTVYENLVMGAFTRSADERGESLDQVHELFPILEERAQQKAETMSGGQQQMLAIGRALMARPRLLLMDEPSMGLAPKLVADVFATIDRIRSTGITVLLVEQNAKRTLETADRGYVIESGEIHLSGTGDELLASDDVRRAYLGL
ncbi:ABC transporter ATP-binding protein [Salsipaludibacter albus]|uniref:ABC transporter ATP-binding protein n=1 Tax=Salsipaludibacter albus TaxID=2849650 RepID=UPI001EE3BDF2|nr:ABC transporter ATP-binding protein [Salsipaludibacter albus]MBY5162119.1 ABC transporter ATP-binding protein [Salsipaludibacter albus]